MFKKSALVSASAGLLVLSPCTSAQSCGASDISYQTDYQYCSTVSWMLQMSVNGYMYQYGEATGNSYCTPNYIDCVGNTHSPVEYKASEEIQSNTHYDSDPSNDTIDVWWDITNHYSGGSASCPLPDGRTGESYSVVNDPIVEGGFSEIYCN